MPVLSVDISKRGFLSRRLMIAIGIENTTASVQKSGERSDNDNRVI